MGEDVSGDVPSVRVVGMDVGDIVEDFELRDDQGVTRSLTGLLADGPVVLFFYPAAMTAGCTAEACHFRDLVTDLKAVGGQPVGISGDAVERQAEFATRNRLGYPLLSDEDGTVRAQFGVKRGAFGLTPTKRITFVIDTDRRILEIIKSEIRMDVHADKAVEALRKRLSA
ncbi:peroxiredoxin [Dactylosporangium sp. NPDC000555]|uniref:peroxiredoxin n=1 Tax=Dactylosporangium sp. NPDC000555 TaxID=3154260 RepID=UPI00331D48BD